ncbi:hypothetical protein HOK31_15425, partial [Candidatus Poribacteria bacterium]|nr:hypothetical protein [Candidatus Poribacteria bacterium]
MKRKTSPRFSRVARAIAVALSVIGIGCGAPEVAENVGLRRVVELRVSHDGPSGLLPGLGSRERAAARILAVTRRVTDLREDATVAGILLRADGGGMTRADVQEITTALEQFRQSGKQVVAYALGLGNASYTLACAADRIVVPPTAVVDVIGLTASVMFYKDLMDKVGVRADFIRAGEYKSAVEPYTRADMSPEHREMLDRLLDDLYAQMTSAIATGRGVSVAEASDIIDGGPYTATEAHDAGLVDALAYEDELDDFLDTLVGEDVELVQTSRPSPSSQGGMGALVSLLQDATRVDAVAHSPNDKIALVHVDGIITTGRGGGLASAGVASSGAVSRAVRRAAEDTT